MKCKSICLLLLLSCLFMLPVAVTGDMHQFQTTGPWTFELSDGEHTLQLYTRDRTDVNSANIGALIFQSE